MQTSGRTRCYGNMGRLGDVGVVVITIQYPHYFGPGTIGLSDLGKMAQIRVTSQRSSALK
jgi:hypothetical protein